MTSPSTERLTEPQKECLRLVLSHHSSKEIAILLGVSPSAVDKRLERAIQLLGAASRFDAARRLAAIERAETCEPLASEPIDLNQDQAPTETPSRIEPSGLIRRLFGIDRTVGQAGEVRNRLSATQRLVVVTALIVGMSVSALVLITVASTMTRLVLAERGSDVSGNGRSAMPQP